MLSARACARNPCYKMASNAKHSPLQETPGFLRACDLMNAIDCGFKIGKQYLNLLHSITHIGLLGSKNQTEITTSLSKNMK